MCGGYRGGRVSRSREVDMKAFFLETKIGLALGTNMWGHPVTVRYGDWSLATCRNTNWQEHAQDDIYICKYIYIS